MALTCDYFIVVLSSSSIERGIRDIEANISRKKPKHALAQEQLAHHKSSLEKARKSLDQAKKAKEGHDRDISALEKELATFEEKRANEEQAFRNAEDDVHLSDEEVRLVLVLSLSTTVFILKMFVLQLEEYESLKDDAARESARCLQELNTLKRSHKSDQDKLENKSRLQKENESRLDRLKKELEEKKKRIEALEENIAKMDEALDEEVNSHDKLEDEVKSSTESVRRLKEQLEKVVQELSAVKCSKHEQARSKKKLEVIVNLRRSFAGVHGRLADLCQARSSLHNLAVAKLLGKHMDSIIVDTKETAIQCIQQLKFERLEPETFLPLASLKVGIF